MNRQVPQSPATVPGSPEDVYWTVVEHGYAEILVDQPQFAAFQKALGKFKASLNDTRRFSYLQDKENPRKYRITFTKSTVELIVNVATSK